MFEPFPTNFVIFFQFSIISIIYHRSGKWPFKRDAIVMISIVIILGQRNYQKCPIQMCFEFEELNLKVVMVGLETRVGTVLGMGEKFVIEVVEEEEGKWGWISHKVQD